MRMPNILLASALFCSFLSAQEGPTVQGSKTDLAYGTSTFFFQVRSEAPSAMTEDQLRSLVGVIIRKTAMHPIYVDEYPQVRVTVRINEASVEWVPGKEKPPVWSATATGQIRDAGDAKGAVTKVVEAFLKDFLEVNAGLLYK